VTTCKLILALASASDPWFQNYSTKGSCDQFINAENGLWSVVCGLWSVVCGLWSVAQDPSNINMALPDNRDVQRQVIEFLQTHIIQ